MEVGVAELYGWQRKERELQRLLNVKRAEPDPNQVKSLGRDVQAYFSRSEKVGCSLVTFFRQSVEKRQKKLVKIADVWAVVIPPMFQQHSALESLHRGTLTVLVDTSAHLYELTQLMLAGTEEQLLFACKSTGLRKILLKLGRWYDGEGEERKLRFD
jgi:hypothetical protein